MRKTSLRKTQTRKASFNKFGLGAIALYIGGLIVVVCAIYGINLSTVLNKWNESERMRARLQTGRMVIGTEDRMQCKTLRFDNRTSQITGETLVGCADLPAATVVSPEGAFSGFRDGFNNR